MKVRLFGCLALLLGLLGTSCRTYSSENTKRPQSAGETAPKPAARDVHSYSNPEQVRVRHVALNLDVLFDRKVLKGLATLTIERAHAGADTLKLDTRDLKIINILASSDGSTYGPAQFTLGEADKILG